MESMAGMSQLERLCRIDHEWRECKSVGWCRLVKYPVPPDEVQAKQAPKRAGPSAFSLFLRDFKNGLQVQLKPQDLFIQASRNWHALTEEQKTVCWLCL
jgi:hypothetical protein